MFLPEHSLAFLLGYDGREHTLESGHFLKFDVKQVERSARVPHGLSYSFTFHAPGGTRLLGLDNAHRAPARGNGFLARPAASDHWHRTEHDKGRPYEFRSAEKLIVDFFDEVGKKLDVLGLPFDVRGDD
jgi:hypothetical protein